MDIADSRGKFRTDFTKAEIATLSPEVLPLFTALRAANVEARKAEQELREATFTKMRLGVALSAAEAELLRHRPPVSEHDAIRAHFRSIGR